jgi:N-hydroxyarylamine O-acetyltransferase
VKSIMAAGEQGLDLDAYWKRIGYVGEVTAATGVLEQIHFAHATQVPFENLDILLGRPIRLDLDSLQRKIVQGRRGGYCFEQNTLFAAVLEEVGFPVTRLLARVRLGRTGVTARTHMVLEVQAGGRAWLADVGFGSGGVLRPVPLEAGPVWQHGAWTFRLAQEPGLWVLQSLRGGIWQDVYAFTQEPQFPIDFEMANHFTSTYPESPFVRNLHVQRTTPEVGYVLRGRELSVARDGQESTRTLADEEELLRVLADPFGLVFPPGTRFRIPGAKT